MHLINLVTFLVFFITLEASPLIRSEDIIKERTVEELIHEITGPSGQARTERLKKLYEALRNNQESDGEQQRLDLSQINMTTINITSNLTSNGPEVINDLEGVSDYLFQGDIYISESQLAYLESFYGLTQEPDEATVILNRKKRQVSSFMPRWIGNTVYYHFHSTLNQRTRDSVATAVNYLQARTCVKFVENPREYNRILIYPGSGCSAGVGMVGGEQQMSLGSGCTKYGTVVHEFMHALGVWHMHMRSDRDEYLSVNLQDVEASKYFNFDLLRPVDEINYTPYDYGSTMHYSATAFTRTGSKGISLLPKDPSYLYTPGSGFVSLYDIHMINERYGCNEMCEYSVHNITCKNGGIPNPATQCATCNCPLGYGGDLCDERPSGCGQLLQASSQWSNLSVSVGEKATIMDFRDVFSTCTYWIQAPIGRQVQLRVVGLNNEQCNYGCPFQGVEFKVLGEKEKINPRICCKEFYQNIFTSQLNPTPVIFYNSFDITDFQIQYRTIVAESDVTQPPVDDSWLSTELTTYDEVMEDDDTTRSPCQDSQDSETCEMMKEKGYCSHSLRSAQYNCARTCNLCPQSDKPCDKKISV